MLTVRQFGYLCRFVEVLPCDFSAHQCFRHSATSLAWRSLRSTAHYLYKASMNPLLSNFSMILVSPHTVAVVTRTVKDSDKYMMMLGTYTCWIYHESIRSQFDYRLLKGWH
jgi:hypothetical protein